MIDKKLLTITFFNYIVGLKLYKYLIIHDYLQGFGLFLGPFIWLGLIVIALSTIAAIMKDTPDYEIKNKNKERVLPNLILVFINAIFPFIALLRLDYYEHLKI